MKITYTEEAIADVIDAITYLNERNPTAAAKLDDDISRCIERLAGAEMLACIRRPIVRLPVGCATG